MADDQSWAEVAEGSREALRHLRYQIGPRYLPGEPDACGGTFAEHAMAHLAPIKAVADHQLMHLGRPICELHDAVYWDARHDLQRGCSFGGHDG